MKENSDLELSNLFWNSYKLFLNDKLSLNELEKALTFPGDVVFYQRKCDSGYNVQKAIKRIIARESDEFISKLFSELEIISNRDEKKTTMQKILLVLLRSDEYFDTVGGELQKLCDDVSIYFSSSLEKSPGNEQLDEALHIFIYLIASAINFVKEEEVLEPVLCKLVLIYACLAVSDRKGAEKCKQLGKKIFTNIWFKSIPEVVTLSYLKKLDHELLPISEFELLERYSF